MLAMMAPDQPAQIAVTSVAIIRQHMARAIVRLCDSVINSFQKNSPFRGWCYFFLSFFGSGSVGLPSVTFSAFLWTLIFLQTSFLVFSSVLQTFFTVASAYTLDALRANIMAIADSRYFIAGSLKCLGIYALGLDLASTWLLFDLQSISALDTAGFRFADPVVCSEKMELDQPHFSWYFASASCLASHSLNLMCSLRSLSGCLLCTSSGRRYAT